MFLHDWVHRGVNLTVVKVVVVFELRCSRKKCPNYIGTRCSYVVAALFVNCRSARQTYLGASPTSSRGIQWRQQLLR